MPETDIFTLVTKAGIQRDGTRLDATGYVDGQWVRFQRGKPRKMGGYRELSEDFVGPVSGLYVWGRQDYLAIMGGSAYGIEQILVDKNGVGASMHDRTPSGYTVSTDNVWTFDAIYNDAVGADETIIVAHPARTMRNIDDGTATPVYIGDAVGTGQFTAIAGVTVSGGVVAINPYLVVFGSDGYVAWSNANEPENFTTGDAGADRVTPFKIVRGLPIRSGGGPAALLWSLDSVLKMQWIGGNDIFRFDTLTTQSSILSSRSVIEYDGVFYWVGVDRFLMFDGAVREVPNQTNINWFFDGLTADQQNKVWAIKVPRYGEIIWFFPKDGATECSHAVVLNVREGVWYDFQLERTAGFQAKVCHHPVMSGEKSEPTSVGMILTSTSGIFLKGEEVVGGTSTARGVIDRYIDTPSVKLNVIPSKSGFQASEVVTGQTSGATGTISGTPVLQDLYDVWLHEVGLDKVTDLQTYSIRSWFETQDLGLPTGFPDSEQPRGTNRWTRLTRIEPDFLQVGDMKVEVVGQAYPNSTATTSEAHTFGPTTEVLDMREQYRMYRLRFESDTAGGDYQMGRVLLHVGPGDGRV